MIKRKYELARHRRIVILNLKTRRSNIVTVEQAALMLGISENLVFKRIKNKSIVNNVEIKYI